MSHMHYLPLAPGFFAILVGFFFIVLILRSVRYAYESLGVSSNTAIFLLFATLIGSFFNIPITELAPERAISHHHVDFFGMRYAVPRGTPVSLADDRARHRTQFRDRRQSTRPCDLRSPGRLASSLDRRTTS